MRRSMVSPEMAFFILIAVTVILALTVMCWGIWRVLE